MNERTQYGYFFMKSIFKCYRILKLQRKRKNFLEKLESGKTNSQLGDNTTWKTKQQI